MKKKSEKIQIIVNYNNMKELIHKYGENAERFSKEDISDNNVVNQIKSNSYKSVSKGLAITIVNEDGVYLNYVKAVLNNPTKLKCSIDNNAAYAHNNNRIYTTTHNRKNRKRPG